MIIDSHTHIYPELVAKKALNTVVTNIGNRLTPFTDGTCESLTASMDAAGVDLSIVLMIATSPGHGSRILQWIKAMMPGAPRMIFFGSVHPYDPNYRELIREMAEAGLQGIKFHPPYQQVPVDAKEAYAVYEEAAKRDLVMYFHAGPDPSVPGCDFSSVERFSVFLKDFEGAKIVLAHGGGYGEWDKVMDLLGGRTCYFDVAFVLENMRRRNDARELFRQKEDYFLFGTDSPWREQKRYVELIRTSNTLTRIQKEKMFCTNIRKLVKV